MRNKLCLRYSLIVYVAKELKSGLDLEVGLVCLDDCTDDGNVDVLCADVVRRRDYGDVDVWGTMRGTM